jgi:hypothetical protein
MSRTMAVLISIRRRAVQRRWVLLPTKGLITQWPQGTMAWAVSCAALLAETVASPVVSPRRHNVNLHYFFRPPLEYCSATIVAALGRTLTIFTVASQNELRFLGVACLSTKASLISGQTEVSGKDSLDSMRRPSNRNPNSQTARPIRHRSTY